jgi:5-formyltetrahydrofolate cyclo-ligase
MDPTVSAWRRQQRATLLAERRTTTPEQRRHAGQIIANELDRIVAAKGCQTIGLYWPIKQEINLLPWSETLARRGGITLCLPVVVTRKAPLEYWRWQQGDPLGRGIWDIPIPARRDVVTPDLVLAPLVGFDRANYRLGYGGGYFDRTLAAFSPRPIVIGIGYAFSAVPTIFPQPHDIPMDAVLTEHERSPAIEASPSHGRNHAL